MEWERADGADGSGASSGGGVPKGKRGGKGKIVLIVVVALIAIFAIARCNSGSSDAKNSKLEWPTSGLATMLPDPGTDRGKVDYNSDSRFSATLAKYSGSDYSGYVDACKEKGFTVEGGLNGSTYKAFNEEGGNHHLANERSGIAGPGPLVHRGVNRPGQLRGLPGKRWGYG